MRERFGRATLKRHKPLTTRKNRAQGYRGCLTVTVLRSRELYCRVEGFVAGTAHAFGALRPPTDLA